MVAGLQRCLLLCPPPLFYTLSLICLYHLCPAQFWSRSQQFSLCVGLCLGRRPWLVIFESSRGLHHSSPFRREQVTLHSLSQWQPLCPLHLLEWNCPIAIPSRAHLWVFSITEGGLKISKVLIFLKVIYRFDATSTKSQRALSLSKLTSWFWNLNGKSKD